MATFVSMPEVRKDRSHLVEVRMTVHFIVAFLPRTVEREPDEFEHWRP